MLVRFHLLIKIMEPPSFFPMRQDRSLGCSHDRASDVIPTPNFGPIFCRAMNVGRKVGISICNVCAPTCVVALAGCSGGREFEIGFGTMRETVVSKNNVPSGGVVNGQNL
jgi:hypothetical protein